MPDDVLRIVPTIATFVETTAARAQDHGSGRDVHGVTGKRQGRRPRKGDSAVVLARRTAREIGKKLMEYPLHLLGSHLVYGRRGEPLGCVSFHR